MLPLGTSSGGLDALRGRSSSVDPVVSLTNSVAILTTSVDKLNDAVVDMVDVGEDATEQTTSSGRKTRRRRQTPVNYKRESDSNWLRIKTPEEKAFDKMLKNDENRSQRRVQFSSFDSSKNQEDFVIIGNAIKSSFDGVKKIFDRLVSPLEELVTNNKKAAAVVGTGVGLSILGLAAAGAIGNAGQAAAEAWNRGSVAGTAGRQALDAQGPRNQTVIPNANPLRPNNNLTPQEQEENRRRIIENQPVTDDEAARIRRQYNSNSAFSTSDDAVPVDDFIEKLTQRLDGGAKNDAQEYNLSPYYQQDLDPRDLETPAFAPIVAAPMGAGAAGSGAGVGGALGGMSPARRGDPVGALNELRRLLDGLAGIMNPSVGAAQRLQRAEEARRTEAATADWNRAAAERAARAPGPAIPNVSDAPSVNAPADVPTPQAPTNIPRIQDPASVPTPQAPTNVPAVAAPNADPVVVRPPVVVPAPPRPDAAPAVQQPAIVQAPAAPATAPIQPSLPLPPPAPPPAPAIPPARQNPVVIMSAPQPPPYIPPTINQPRATGGGNIGRGVGFAPPPPSPSSPTARTPSYPSRSF